MHAFLSTSEHVCMHLTVQLVALSTVFQALTLDTVFSLPISMLDILLKRTKKWLVKVSYKKISNLQKHSTRKCRHCVSSFLRNYWGGEKNVSGSDICCIFLIIMSLVAFILA